jgi:hypothetical protein
MAGAVSGVWAVVPTAGRPYLEGCLSSLDGQVDGIVLVANGGYIHPDTDDCVVVEHHGPVNISRWWNRGIDECPPGSDILILNDDTEMAPGSVAVLSDGLRSSGRTLAFPGPHLRRLKPDSPERITGWCFMLRGEDGMRADESFVWWYGDNDLDWRCRSARGSVMIPGVGHVHHDPNGYTNRVPELAAQTGRDRETFLARWGRLPH